MLWFQKASESSAADPSVIFRLPNEVFPWPRGIEITAIDGIVLALPVTLFNPYEPMREFLSSPKDMGIKFFPDRDVYFIMLKPGTSVRLAKSCDTYVVADDDKPRRLKMSNPDAKASGDND